MRTVWNLLAVDPPVSPHLPASGPIYYNPPGQSGSLAIRLQLVSRQGFTAFLVASKQMSAKIINLVN